MSEQELYEPVAPEPAGPAPATVLELPGSGPAAEETPVAEAKPQPTEVAPVRRGRPGWLIPVAIAAIGVIVAGVLGGLLYVNTGQRDLARKQLAATTADLATTKGSLGDAQTQLATAQSAAAAQAATDRYVNLFVVDNGRVEVDYHSMNKACAANDYNGCRSDAQQVLTDLQAFQTDRDGAKVPNSLAATDGQLKDSLSAAIAAMQETIGGLDNGKDNEITDGVKKFEDALLGIAKAESTLGAATK